ERDESAQMQNEAVGRLARMLNIKLPEAVSRRVEASRRVEQKSALDSDPRDLLLYAWDMINRVTTASALQEVLRVFERVLRLEPRSVSAKKRGRAGNPRLYFPHLYLAAALGLKGDIDGARIALPEAIKVGPQFNSFARLRAYIRLGTSQHRALYERTIKLGLRQ